MSIEIDDCPAGFVGPWSASSRRRQSFYQNVAPIPTDADNRAQVSQLVFRLPGVFKFVSRAVSLPDETKVTNKSAPTGVHDEESSGDEGQNGDERSDATALREFHWESPLPETTTFHLSAHT